MCVGVGGLAPARQALALAARRDDVVATVGVHPHDAAANDAAAEAAESAPHFGEAIVNDYVRCPLWPVEEEPLEPVTAPGAPPILVVSTTGDPATPYEAGVRTAERLESGVLLTYDGDGHTVVANGVACVDEIVADYLVDLEVPEDGTTCTD